MIINAIYVFLAIFTIGAWAGLMAHLAIDRDWPTWICFALGFSVPVALFIAILPV
jgi:hypothetical protein